MDENNISTEVSESDLNAFDDEDWGEVSVTDSTETEPEDTSETAEGDSESKTGEAPEAAADQPEGTGAEAGEPGDAGESTAEGQDKAGDQRFELTYMQETHSVSRDEVIALAQKGMDYDRIRGRYDGLNKTLADLGGLDSLREYAEFVKELAQSAGVTPAEAMDSTRAGIISRRDKVDMGLALERVKRQRAEKALADRDTRAKESTAAEKKRDTDFTEFVKAYPGVKDLPAEVWDAYRKGENLVAAYARHEAREAKAEADKLRAQMAAAQKNQANRQKAAPSQQTAGTKGKTIDPFDEGWDD